MSKKESNVDDCWYADGLQFECTQCGNCCTGDPGVVWVTEDELAAIANHTGENIGAIKLLHTRQVRGQTSLTEHANGDCTYFDPETRRCRIYPVRPVQCRTWPFWNSNLATPDTWTTAGRDCPGIGCGDLVPLVEIQKRADEIDV